MEASLTWNPPSTSGEIHRLEFQNLFAGQALCGYAGVSTAPFEPFDIVAIIVRQLYEQTAQVLDAMPGDVAEHLALLSAFPGRLLVAHHVTSPAMEQPMVPPAGTTGEVALLQEHHGSPAHGHVAGDARSRGPAADDEDVYAHRELASRAEIERDDMDGTPNSLRKYKW